MLEEMKIIHTAARIRANLHGSKGPMLFGHIRLMIPKDKR